MMKIKHIILDADDTLYDWHSFTAVYLNTLLDSVERELVYEAGTMAFINEFREKSQVNPENPWLAYNFDSLEEIRDVAIVADEQALLTASRYLRWVPGLQYAINTLKKSGIELSIFSLAPRYCLEYRLRRLGLIEPFHTIFCSPNPTMINEEYEIPENTEHDRKFSELLDDTQLYGKSRTRELELICARLELNPREVVIVDDYFNSVNLAQLSLAGGIWAEYGTHISPVIKDMLAQFYPAPLHPRPTEETIKGLAAKSHDDNAPSPFYARISSIGLLPELISFMSTNN